MKNAGLGFAIPYLHNGQTHDYLPDFLVRLRSDSPLHLIVETKGYDLLADIKAAAAERWIAAVNADTRYGKWFYVQARSVAKVREALENLRGASLASGRSVP